MTSGPRHRALTRSRSLALPLADKDLSLPSDPPPHGTDALSSDTATGMLRTGQTTGRGGPVKEPKKTLRRQKSLAELFGVVLQRSKAQLQELFSRRDKDGKVRRDVSPAAVTQEPEAGASGSMVAGIAADVEGAVGASSSVVAAVSAPAPPPQLKQRLVPQGRSACLRNSNPEISSTSPRMASASHCRTPEELFCVTRSGTERPISAHSLDTLHRSGGHTETRRAHSPRDEDRGSLLRPDRDCKAKAALVKSNSDSLCRLLLVGQDGGGGPALTKASSDDACFSCRSPSPALLPRDRAVRLSPRNTLTTNSNTKPETWSSISSIVDWMLVGSVEAAYNDPLLCSLDVEAVVDITNVTPNRVPAEKKTTCPCTCGKKHFRSKLNLAVDDIEWENIEQHFADVNAFLHGWRKRGKRVIVVSYHGKSRAPAIAVQHLMTYFRVPMQRALAHVHARRPQTRINPGFLRALQRLEKRLMAEWQEDGEKGKLEGGEELSLPKASPPPFPDSLPLGPKTAWDDC